MQVNTVVEKKLYMTSQRVLRGLNSYIVVVLGFIKVSKFRLEALRLTRKGSDRLGNTRIAINRLDETYLRGQWS